MKFREIEKISLSDGWVLKASKGSHNHYINFSQVLQGALTSMYKQGA